MKQPISCLLLVGHSLFSPQTLNIQLVALGHICPLNWLSPTFAFLLSFVCACVCVYVCVCSLAGQRRESSLRLKHKHWLMLYTRLHDWERQGQHFQNRVSQRPQQWQQQYFYMASCLEWNHYARLRMCRCSRQERWLSLEDVSCCAFWGNGSEEMKTFFSPSGRPVKDNTACCWTVAVSVLILMVLGLRLLKHRNATGYVSCLSVSGFRGPSRLWSIGIIGIF